MDKEDRSAILDTGCWIIDLNESELKVYQVSSIILKD